MFVFSTLSDDQVLVVSSGEHASSQGAAEDPKASLVSDQILDGHMLGGIVGTSFSGLRIDVFQYHKVDTTKVPADYVELNVIVVQTPESNVGPYWLPEW
jgi:hypothetical protein